MSRRVITALMLWMCAACVSVPKPSHDDADITADASWPDELVRDAGAQRPPTGEAYVGPECDPEQPGGGANSPSAAHADGGVMSDASSAEPGVETPPRTDAGGKPIDDPAQPRHPLPGEIVITEIMSDPAAVADTAGEWFELHNPNAEARDLGGCAIDDGAAKPHPMPAPFVIAKGEYVVVGRAVQAGLVPDLMLSFSLGNAADTLVLICDGREIDRVTYGEGFPLAAGASMSLEPDATADDNDAPVSWCLAQTEYACDRGTPGEANPTCDDVVAIDGGVE
jgi:hypothetical protein